MSATTLAPDRPSSGVTFGLTMKLGAFLLLLGGAIAVCSIARPAATVSEAGVVMQWPDEVMGFTGKKEEPSEGELALLPEDTEFAKMFYTNPEGESISAQIVLSGVEHRSIHRPEICLTGQGWSVKSGEVVQVPLASGHNLDVMVLDISRPVTLRNGTVTEVPALYAYFFVSRDAQTPRHYERIALTNMDLLFNNRSHRWAYVIAMTQVLEGLKPGGKSREEALQFIKDFFREAAPHFLKSEMGNPVDLAAQSPAPVR